MPFNSSQVLESSRLPRGLDQWATRIVAYWNYPALKSRMVHAFLLLTIGAICVLRAYIGLTGTSMFTHDAFMTFDGAWRIFNHQRPHVDFYSHLGILTYAPTVLGLLMAHGTAAAFGYGQAFVAFALGLWAYSLARNRLNDVVACLMSLVVTLMAAGPSALGFAPLPIAPAMTYNRQAYAVLALILIEALADPRQDRKASDFVGGLSTGLAIVILLFLKITYFVFALLLIGVFALVRRQAKQRWTGLLIGFGGVFLIFCAYFGFNLAPMVRDLATVARTKHFRLDWYFIDEIFVQGATLLVTGLIAAALLWLHGKRQPARVLAIGSSAVCIASALLLLGNYELTGFPIAAFLALLIIQAVTVHIRDTDPPSSLLLASVLLLGSVFVGGFLGVQSLTLPYGVAVKLFKAPRFTGFDSPILKTFVPIDGDAQYTDFVNQGFRLLARYRHPDETIMSLDFTNPFSYGVGIKPAPGGTTVLQYRTTFDNVHRQSAQSLFGEAYVVMIPTPGFFSDGSLEYSIIPFYGSYLDSHFTLIAQNKFWRLYRRNSMPRPMGGAAEGVK